MTTIEQKSAFEAGIEAGITYIREHTLHFHWSGEPITNSDIKGQYIKTVIPRQEFLPASEKAHRETTKFWIANALASIHISEALKAERAKLIAENDAAKSWGAAVGARSERIKEIDRVIAVTGGNHE